MPRQSREKGPTERRAHAGAQEAGLRWSELAGMLELGEKSSRSQDTLTRRLRDIDEKGRSKFPYETADGLLKRIVKACRLRDDFFQLSLSADESEFVDPKRVPDHLQDAPAESEPESGEEEQQRRP